MTKNDAIRLKVKNINNTDHQVIYFDVNTKSEYVISVDNGKCGLYAIVKPYLWHKVDIRDVKYIEPTNSPTCTGCDVDRFIWSKIVSKELDAAAHYVSFMFLNRRYAA